MSVLHMRIHTLTHQQIAANVGSREDNTFNRRHRIIIIPASTSKRRTTQSQQPNVIHMQKRRRIHIHLATYAFMSQLLDANPHHTKEVGSFSFVLLLLLWFDKVGDVRVVDPTEFTLLYSSSHATPMLPFFKLQLL